MNGSKNKREVDRLARSVSAWWKKSLRYTTLKQIMTWKALLLILFAVGIVSGIIWSVALKIETRSKAATGSAILTWNANTEADLAGYKIYYGTTPRTGSCPSGGYASSINVGKVTTYTINNLTEGQTYYFSTTAYDATGNESCFSAEVSKLIPVTLVTYPAPVLNSVKTSGTDFILSWSQAGEAPSGGFDIVIDGVDMDTTYRTTGTSVTIGGLSIGTQHCFKIQGRFIQAEPDQWPASNEACGTIPAPDTTNPTVSITSPTNGATVSGNAVSFAANASDNVGVTKVEFYSGSTIKYTDTSAPYGFSWDTTISADGNHQLTAKAYDAAGNVGSSSISVTVKNVTGDTTAPTVTISKPANGSTVSGTVAIAATAKDDTAIVAMGVYVDGRKVASAAAGSISYSWNTRKATAGTHTIMVRAADAKNNTGESSITVTVTAPTTGKNK